MPKEVIGPQGEPWRTRVGWSPETVQVGVEDDGPAVELLFGDPETLAQIGAKMRTVALDSASSDEYRGRAVVTALLAVAPYRGVWATLTRSDCNHLIQVVRRARDSAFGKDE